jgi:hypothetical protein
LSPANLLNHPICPWATSLTGLDSETTQLLLIALPCKRWGCPICARQKVRVLAAKTQLAAPNRLLTLTIDPKKYNAPRDAFEATAPLVPELIRLLRKRFGQIEYLRVTEVTKAGWPHYHLLIRSSFIPQPVVKAAWNKLTGAIIVDLRQVQKSFSAFTYLVKYLTKLHRLEWTERHVSYSRSFFPEECNAARPKSNLTHIERIKEHPYTYMYSWFPGQCLTQIRSGAWLLDRPANDTQTLVDPLAIGVAETHGPATV